MSISAAKMAAALGGAGAVGTGGYFAVKNLPSTPLSIRESLLKEEYKLISDIEDQSKRETQYKNTFLVHREDTKFLEEINKLKDGNENIAASESGDKGKVALEKLCSSYLSSADADKLKNAQQWCVLRVMDEEVSGRTWIPLGENKDDEWKSSFDENKDLLVSLKIKGIESTTDKDNGHSKVKEWCSSNSKLTVNKGSKDTANHVKQICSKKT
ncbi:hypothetical protein MHF_0574 [Mycoplasma haemofelis Ohio2]|uniref:Uncharacterized protein n=1 Tax=Mycoplasma haemofelis (strain Ohio2) TaxID=859194 RepID=F6FHZ8_MYCHI|nr:hypothetical protein MHF_0574 [Mycoplasma haemofelis Ohio2]